jgi:hypothetical protein
MKRKTESSTDDTDREIQEESTAEDAEGRREKKRN